MVKNVVPDSPAFQAGLSFRYVIVAIEGMRVNASSIGKRLSDARSSAATSSAKPPYA